MRYGVMVMELYDKHVASSLCVLSLSLFLFPPFYSMAFTRGHLFNRDQSIFGTASDWAGKKGYPPTLPPAPYPTSSISYIFSHRMTVPYDYHHHHLLLRAGSQHSAKENPPYHTIPYHTAPHCPTQQNGVFTFSCTH